MVDRSFLSNHTHYLSSLSAVVIVLALLHEVDDCINACHLADFLRVLSGPFDVPLVELAQHVKRTKLSAHRIVRILSRLLRGERAYNFFDCIECNYFRRLDPLRVDQITGNDRCLFINQRRIALKSLVKQRQQVCLLPHSLEL